MDTPGAASIVLGVSRSTESGFSWRWQPLELPGVTAGSILSVVTTTAGEGLVERAYSGRKHLET
jgi:hypothetical protein